MKLSLARPRFRPLTTRPGSFDAEELFCSGIPDFAAAGCATDRGEEAINESLYQAALEAGLKGDYPAAAGHFSKLRERLPDDRIALLGLARNLRYLGSARDAVRLLEVETDTFADDPAFLTELGKAKVASGAAPDAIELFKEALEHDSGNWDIHAALGIAYDMAGAYGKAQESYRNALVVSKDNPRILNNLAISAALTGNLEKAVEILEQAAKIDRHNPQIRQNLAFFYGIKGDVDSAEALARMDLDEESVRNNLSVYSSFRK